MKIQSTLMLSDKIRPRRSVPDVTLVAEDGTVDPGDGKTAKWQHVANEGQFLGYKRGTQPFAFTRQTFDQIVANFRQNPQYNAGADGVGEAEVIPWDFEHASQMYAADGTIPTDGAPAQGWIRELKVMNAQDGKAQLWALTLFLPTALEYIKAGQYKWSSVSVILQAVDVVTNENIGALLTSVALTNIPVLQDLEALAASAKAGRELRVSRWYEAAGTAMEAIGSIRDLFGLKELAPLTEVLGEVAKIQMWIDSGTTPLGVDLVEIFAGVKQILGLGVLTTEIEVLDALGKIAQRAIEEQAVAEGGTIKPPEPMPGEFNAAATARKTGETEMIKKLASKFGVNEIESEVLEAAGDAVVLRSDAAKALCSTSSKTKDIIDGIAGLVSDKENHVALLTALGVDKIDDAVLCVATLQKAAKDLEELTPEHEELKKRIDDIDLKTAKSDVEMVIKANGFDESITDALMLQRAQNPEVFAEKFPIDAAKLALTQRVTEIVPAGGTTPASPAGGDVIDLSMYPGANKTARAVSYLQSKNPALVGHDWDEVSLMAHTLLKRPNVVDGV